MSKGIRCAVALAAALALAVGLGAAVGHAENIDPYDAGDQYAWGENVGWLNAEPSGDGGPGVHVYGTHLEGYMWGENIGWISFGDDSPVQYQVVTSWRGAAYTENIDPYDAGDQYAWGENVGWLNAEPSFDGGPGILVTDTHLEGYMWGENIGWVSLACENRDSCATVDYGVDNDGAGNLSGYAWAENAGWISFRDDAPVAYGVTIDPATGVFSGNAWGENIGWISFSDDSPVQYQVVTSWRGAAYAENIDPFDVGDQYAWGENVGWLNAEPSFDGGPGVRVLGSELQGYMWGENIGWVSLCCHNTGSCDTVGYCVGNDGAGNLEGHAWGENVGWISFSCLNTGSCGSAPYGVTIDPATGEFSGYAWGENIGWINFGGANPQPIVTSWSSACVPGSDTDGDGWDDGDEWAITTDCMDDCSNHGGHAALPPDINNDQTVNILDVLMYKPQLGGTDPRYDLTVDSAVNILDVLLYKVWLGHSCV